MTSHNRATSTLACLEALYASTTSAKLDVGVVLVDAGSSDGTVSLVRQRFPAVTVVERGPELFWNGGMRVALAHAYPSDPDHYLWLNDDVVLDADAIERLLAAHSALEAAQGAPVVAVGSTRDPASGEATYGGVTRPDRLRRLSYEMVPPACYPRPAETMNGNCVLVPRGVVDRIGNLAAAFTHGMGDFDYGHRARRAGCEVWIVEGTIGTCARNEPSAPATSIAEYRRRATAVKGGLPPREWVTFARRWAGPLWPLYAGSPYLRGLLRTRWRT